MIDNRELQKLVDGELSFEDTQRLLRNVDRQAGSQLWRTIAGAFIENRILQSQFVERELADLPQKLSDNQNSASGSTDTKTASVRWFSLAASLLLAVSVGLIVGALNNSLPQQAGVPLSAVDSPPPMESVQRNQPYVAAADSRDGIVSDHLDGDDLNQTPAVYRMQVEDPSGNQFLDSDVPLYSGGNSDAAKWLRNVDLPQSVRTRAADSGYRVDQDIRYLSGKLSDGRTFVIPVRKFSFLSEQ